MQPSPPPPPPPPPLLVIVIVRHTHTYTHPHTPRGPSLHVDTMQPAPHSPPPPELVICNRYTHTPTRHSSLTHTVYHTQAQRALSSRKNCPPTPPSPPPHTPQLIIWQCYKHSTYRSTSSLLYMCVESFQPRNTSSDCTCN